MRVHSNERKPKLERIDNIGYYWWNEQETPATEDDAVSYSYLMVKFTTTTRCSELNHQIAVAYGVIFCSRSLLLVPPVVANVIYTLAPLSEGLDFIGYVFYPTGVRLRPRIYKSAVEALDRGHFFPMASYYGWLLPTKHNELKELYESTFKRKKAEARKNR